MRKNRCKKILEVNWYNSHWHSVDVQNEFNLHVFGPKFLLFELSEFSLKAGKQANIKST